MNYPPGHPGHKGQSSSKTYPPGHPANNTKSNVVVEYNDIGYSQTPVQPKSSNTLEESQIVSNLRHETLLLNQKIYNLEDTINNLRAQLQNSDFANKELNNTVHRQQVTISNLTTELNNLKLTMLNNNILKKQEIDDKPSFFSATF